MGFLQWKPLLRRFASLEQLPGTGGIECLNLTGCTMLQASPTDAEAALSLLGPACLEVIAPFSKRFFMKACKACCTAQCIVIQPFKDATAYRLLMKLRGGPEIVRRSKPKAVANPIIYPAQWLRSWQGSHWIEHGILGFSQFQCWVKQQGRRYTSATRLLTQIGSCRFLATRSFFLSCCLSNLSSHENCFDCLRVWQ